MPRQTQRWCFLMSLLATGVIFITSDCNLLQAQTETSQDFTPVTDAMLADPSDDDWLMWRRTLDGWGYSPLDQINRENVAELQMVWTRGLARGAQEGTPLAYDGVLYMPQASDTIHAINAETGDLIWAYQRSLPEDVYE